MSNPKYRLLYAPAALKQLQKLDLSVADSITSKLEQLTNSDQPLLSAKSLRGELAGKYRYRIGNYRAIFSIDADGVITLLTILDIKYRKDIYK